MESIVGTRTKRSLDVALKSAYRGGALSAPRTGAWRQRLVNLTLVFSDVVFALFTWGIACIAEILWVPGHLSGEMVLSAVPITLVWVGLRATQGLYPGYGMDEAEELKHQTYALLATVAIAGIFELAFQVGSPILRFLLSLTFAGLLFLSPFVRHFVKRWMMRPRVWDKPVIILGDEDSGVRLEESLVQEWALGFKPIALFDGHQEDWPVEGHEGGERRIDGDVLEEAVELGKKHRIDTIFLAMPRAPREYLAKLADAAGVHFRSVVVIPDLGGGISDSIAVVRNLAGTLGMEVRHNLLDHGSKGLSVHRILSGSCSAVCSSAWC